MVMELDFKGRVNNTKVPHSSGLDTLLEAVVNSIQAMDPACDNPRIDITPITFVIPAIDEHTKSQSITTGFIITDNGFGFNDDNYKSFKRVDSTHKYKLGCKGIGRLSWLKVFSNVTVDSVYLQNGCKFRRRFQFNLMSDGVSGGDNPVQVSFDEPILTTIKLENCKEQYQKSIQGGPKLIATRIFDHCLAYFLHGGRQPLIKIHGDKEIEIVNDIYDSTKDRIVHPDPINVGGYIFDIYHVRFKNSSGNKGISFCANNLHVKRVESFDGIYTDSDGQEFRYVCFVYGNLLDEYVNSSRDGFDLPDKERSLDNPKIPCIREIVDYIRPICVDYLKPFSDLYLKKCSDRLKKFTDSESGKVFSPIIKYDPNLLSFITPNMSDEIIYSKCSESLSKIESGLIFKIPHSSKQNTVVDDHEALEEEFRKITDVQKSQLAKLIVHRGLILSAYDERLEAIGKVYSNDKIKFERELESVIHDLILPRGTDSKNRPTIETCNLWIIDERLEYYAYYGSYSDKKLCDFSNNASSLRPDVFVFGDITDNMEAKSVCIIEFKRPGRSDLNIVNQIYDYIDALRHHEIENYLGESVSITDNTLFYCYAICNTASDDIKKLASRNQMKSQFGDRGYFVWNGEYNCSMDLLDHHKVFSDAKNRNKIFFETIGFEVSSDAVIVTKPSDNRSIKIVLNSRD